MAPHAFAQGIASPHIPNRDVDHYPKQIERAHAVEHEEVRVACWHKCVHEQARDDEHDGRHDLQRAALLVKCVAHHEPESREQPAARNDGCDLRSNEIHRFRHGGRGAYREVVQEDERHVEEVKQKAKASESERRAMRD